MAVMFPRPHAARFGTARPPTLRAQFASVFAPVSPYAAASGSSPAPSESDDDGDEAADIQDFAPGTALIP